MVSANAALLNSSDEELIALIITSARPSGLSWHIIPALLLFTTVDTPTALEIMTGTPTDNASMTEIPIT